MLLKINNYVLKIIKKAKISMKLTIVYAFMFSLVLLLLNASILYGVKYYLYNQANKQIEDIESIMLNKITSQGQKLDLSNKEIFTDVPSKENISIRIIQKDSKIINSSENFYYKLKGPQDDAEKSEDKEKTLGR